MWSAMLGAKLDLVCVCVFSVLKLEFRNKGMYDCMIAVVVITDIIHI